MFTILLADLCKQGVSPDPHEAIAIAQQLIHTAAASPSPDNVQLASDGTVTCVGCDVTPAVFEMAILLHTLVPPGTPGVPGGLRYTIARGLLDVEAPPFDSIRELSRALQRFEIGDRRAVVRALLRRLPHARAAVVPLHHRATAAPPPMPREATLRLELRPARADRRWAGAAVAATADRRIARASTRWRRDDRPGSASGSDC